MPAAVPNAVNNVEQDDQHCQQQGNRNQGKDNPENTASGKKRVLCVLSTVKQMDLPEQLQGGCAIISGLKAAGQTGIHKTAGLRGQSVIEPAAGDHISLPGTGIQQEQGVIFPQLHFDGPVPCFVLQGTAAAHSHHGHNAACLVPVGVIQAQGLFLLTGEHTGFIDNVCLVSCGGKIFV